MFYHGFRIDARTCLETSKVCRLVDSGKYSFPVQVNDFQFYANL